VNHAQFGFGAAGQHRGVSCRAGMAGGQPASGRSARFADCHIPSHAVTRRPPRCVKCHETRRQLAAGASIDHARLGFPLLGRHSTLKCQELPQAAPPSRLPGGPAPAVTRTRRRTGPVRGQALARAATWRVASGASRSTTAKDARFKLTGFSCGPRGPRPVAFRCHPESSTEPARPPASTATRTTPGELGATAASATRRACGSPRRVRDFAHRCVQVGGQAPGH